MWIHIWKGIWGMLNGGYFFKPRGKHESGQAQSLSLQKKKSQLRFSVLPVLVFHGYYNKVSQTGWLKTTEVYSPIFLEARNLKSTCQQDQFLLRSPKENLFHGFFTASGTASNSLSSLACRPITPISTFIVTWPFPLCVSVSPSVSCKKTHQWLEGPP